MMSGQEAHRCDIEAITNGLPCSVTTTEEHGYSTGHFVRLTDLNGSIPTVRGMDQLNNYRFRIIVTGVDTFTLQHPVSHEPIDSTTFPPYVSGGYCNLIAENYIYEGDDEDE